ncbi:hypothetical protein LBMAG54_06070 [Nitrosopumilaceae archaeon]|nr:hypothetical protein EMGBD3_12700 [Nitrosarchaeum sp.]GDY15751.1 hypothetical protein LBMAG54_06070 [Nitrosopumilaceae archaeon]
MNILPHVVFSRKIDLLDLSKNFTGIFQKNPILIKISTIFVQNNCLSALLPTIVIDNMHREFLIEISTTKLKTTIRLYPLTDPDKTDGVKSSLALLTKYLLVIYPDLKITKSNIFDYIDGVISR